MTNPGNTTSNRSDNDVQEQIDQILVADQISEATVQQTQEQDWGDLSLMNLFRIEVETQVKALNEHLIAVENADSPNDARYRDRLDALMRAAHSIKGAARIVQVEAAVKVAHALEDCFIAAQQNVLTLTSDRIDVLLMGTDLLFKLSELEEQTLLASTSRYEADVDDVVVALAEMISVAEQEKVHTQSVQTRRIEPAGTDVEDTTTENLSQPEASAETSPNSIPSSKGLQKTQAKTLQNADDTNRTIRISADNLNRLMGLAGELLVESNWLAPFERAMLETKRQQQQILSLIEQQVIAPNENSAIANKIGEMSAAMQTCQSLLSDRISDVEQFSQRFSQLSDRLYREVIASHMCAFEEGTQGYARLVRDVSKQQHKQAALEVIGLTTQVDRDILSKLDTPLTHLITNAIIHSIEPPDIRLSKGKPGTATIKLSAMHRSGMLLVDVEDDGAGIDFTRLRSKTVEKKLVDSSVVNNLSKAELIEFLFLPGFSTSSRIDNLSGRGYGLDLAREMAQSVGGSLQAFSPISSLATDGLNLNAAREGTRFRFCLPLTLSVMRSLLFEVANETYAISLSRISRVIKLSKEHIHYCENKPYFRLDNHNISIVSAHQILDLGHTPPLNAARSKDKRLSIVIVGEAEDQYGICVDRLFEEQDLVVRPLDARLGKVPNISAAALSEKGMPILILDVADVLRSAEKASTRILFEKSGSQGHLAQEAGTSVKVHQTAPVRKKVLVVDDSMTVRVMEKNLLQSKGYVVDMAVDGAEGWNAVRATNYDLVITDVDMPRMNGIELIRNMRNYEATRDLPVIVVSYKDRESDQLAGLEAGANYYLTKSSFHNDGFITAVVDLIGA